MLSCKSVCVVYSTNALKKKNQSSCRKKMRNLNTSLSVKTVFKERNCMGFCKDSSDVYQLLVYYNQLTPLIHYTRLTICITDYLTSMNFPTVWYTLSTFHLIYVPRKHKYQFLTCCD